MGQRTLAFTKQMLRVFNLVELEELDTWSPTLDLRSLEARKCIAIYSRRTSNINRHKQTNIYIYIYIYIYICIRTLHHSNKT
jgi:hypothetical protein